MVGILREQTRNYTAADAGAARAESIAHGLSSLSSIGSTVGSLVKTAQKEDEKILEKEKKDLFKADQEMIDTQIGSTLSNELMSENAKRIANGVDPNTPEYNKWLESERQRIFQPYIDQMQSEEGRLALQKMARDTTDKLVASNIGKIAQNRKAAQAQAAFAATGKQYNNDAYEFGKLGDWDAFQEGTKAQYDAMVKFQKKKGGDEAAAATEFQLGYNGLINYLGGYAQSEPETVVAMLDKDGDAHEQLKGIVPEKVLDKYTESYTNMLKEQKRTAQERLKSLPAGSKAHDALKKQIKELDEKIANPEEEAFGLLREDLARVVLPEAKKNAEKAALARKQMEERYQVDTFAATISPDAQERFNAKSAIGGPITRANSYIKNLMADKETKGPFAKLKKAYNDATEAAKTVLKTDPEMPQKQEVQYKASQAAAEALNKALAEGDMPDIERLTYGFEAIAELHKTPGMTEENIEKFQNILHAGLYDKVFGGMASNVIQNPDRLFPDNSWMQNLFANPMGFVDPFESQEYKRSARNIMGLPSDAIRDTDIDTVDKYFRSNAIRISDTAIDMLDKAAQLPTTELRQAAVQEVAKYVASEKEKVYNTAIKNYGIDLAMLREQKKTTGRAFTSIGGVVYEYMGDTPEKKPIFEIPSQWNLGSEIKSRIEANMKMLEKKGEKDGK